MLNGLLARWRDWTGDKLLERAIRNELRARGYAASSASIRDVRLAAIERPGWVQVYRFRVETSVHHENPHKRREALLFGVSRDDGRKSRIAVVLSEDEGEYQQQLDSWSDGLIRR